MFRSIPSPVLKDYLIDIHHLLKGAPLLGEDLAFAARKVRGRAICSKYRKSTLHVYLFGQGVKD
jgi:hypothetical protein